MESSKLITKFIFLQLINFLIASDMLLVWPVLQHSDLQYCLSRSTSNIQSSNIACHAPLATFSPPTMLVTPHLQYSALQYCLSSSTCNIQPPNIASRTPLAIFSLPTLLVTPHLQHSDLLFILFRLS